MHIPETEFATATARIRVLENNLLTPTIVERMVDAKNAEDALRLFNELDYARHMGDVASAINFQKAVNGDLKETKDLLEGLVPSDILLRYLWYPYDIHNAKLMLKGKLGNVDYTEHTADHVIALGNISVEALHNYIYENVRDSFEIANECEDAMIKEGIEAAIAAFSETNDPQMIDITLDQTLYSLLAKTTAAFGSEFLDGFTQKRIDLYNITLFKRLHGQEGAKDLLEKTFVDGGSFEKAAFLKVITGGIDAFTAIINRTPYAKIVNQSETLFAFEIAAANFIADYFKTTKIVPYGPEPVLAYFFAKENNALVTRMIMVSKLSGVEPTEIKKRLRNIFN